MSKTQQAKQWITIDHEGNVGTTSGPISVGLMRHRAARAQARRLQLWVPALRPREARHLARRAVAEATKQPFGYQVSTWFVPTEETIQRAITVVELRWRARLARSIRLHTDLLGDVYADAMERLDAAGLDFSHLERFHQLAQYVLSERADLTTD